MSEPVTVTETSTLDMVGYCPSCFNSWKGVDKDTGVFSRLIGVYSAARIPQVSWCCPHCHKEFDRDTQLEVPPISEEVKLEVLADQL